MQVKFKRDRNEFGQTNSEAIAVIQARDRRWLGFWTIPVVLAMEVRKIQKQTNVEG